MKYPEFVNVSLKDRFRGQDAVPAPAMGSKPQAGVPAAPGDASCSTAPIPPPTTSSGSTVFSADSTQAVSSSELAQDVSSGTDLGDMIGSPCPHSGGHNLAAESRS